MPKDEDILQLVSLPGGCQGPGWGQGSRAPSAGVPAPPDPRGWTVPVRAWVGVAKYPYLAGDPWGHVGTGPHQHPWSSSGCRNGGTGDPGQEGWRTWPLFYWGASSGIAGGWVARGLGVWLILGAPHAALLMVSWGLGAAVAPAAWSEPRGVRGASPGAPPVPAASRGSPGAAVAAGSHPRLGHQVPPLLGPSLGHPLPLSWGVLQPWQGGGHTSAPAPGSEDPRAWSQGCP